MKKSEVALAFVGAFLVPTAIGKWISAMNGGRRLVIWSVSAEQNSFF